MGAFEFEPNVPLPTRFQYDSLIQLRSEDLYWCVAERATKQAAHNPGNLYNPCWFCKNANVPSQTEFLKPVGMLKVYISLIHDWRIKELKLTTVQDIYSLLNRWIYNLHATTKLLLFFPSLISVPINEQQYSKYISPRSTSWKSLI